MQKPVSREVKGKAIAENGNVKKVNDHSFKVKSQSGKGIYEVKATPNGMTCTCPDFVYHGGKCKHIQATRYYLEIEKDTPTGTVTEKVHLTYAQAWNAYNEAQKAEVNLFDDLLKDLVKAIPEPGQNKGRPRLSLQETLFCAIQKVYSRFNAPSDFFNKPETTAILQNLVTLSALPVAGIEVDFAVDSTGFRTTTFNSYEGAKYGQKKEHQWVKAHLCAGVKTNVVAAVAITDDYSNDSPQFGPLVKKTAQGFAINEISADRAYSSRANLQTVANEGGKAYIPFKKNATGNCKGSRLWSKMFHYFQLNRDEFMDHYHKRSNIEATNAAIKRKFGETLKSKNPVAQVNELLAKIIAYNLTVVIHEMYENGIEAKFLNQTATDKR
jgi:transposase